MSKGKVSDCVKYRKSKKLQGVKDKNHLVRVEPTKLLLHKLL